MVQRIAGLGNRGSSAMLRPLRRHARLGEEEVRRDFERGGNGDEIVNIAAPYGAFYAGERGEGHGPTECGDACGELA
ncbi:hypothetical protein GCM10010326_72120 [Streptomyces xanthochromogenes]|uniref:Uncharacterized protein n=1 Tax=Streptomyces xanthochromogenes TaxID=67384 RepID=A0ABQ3AXM8_9ACTN|nr:hypothetical protein GCM10010326_72120 [Streptomyces xanthochromogenes]